MTTQHFLDIIASGEKPDMADVIPYGLTNALTCMLVVFAVLGILYLVLSISGALFARLGNQGKGTKKEKTPKPIQTKREASVSDEVLAVINAAVCAAQNDGELIAVLTAAVEASRAEAGETGSFRVVSFRRR